MSDLLVLVELCVIGLALLGGVFVVTAPGGKK